MTVSVCYLACWFPRTSLQIHFLFLNVVMFFCSTASLHLHSCLQFIKVSENSSWLL